MPVKGMTQAEIDAATRAQVAAGIKSTSKTAKLEGETYAEANARIAAGYKEMTAKPILSAAQKDGGMKVQFVRTQAGGVGEYVAVKPLNYTGPTTVKTFTAGVIPANAKYTTGASVGVDSTAKPKVTATAVVAPTVTPTGTAAPAADAATAVRKLQSGQTLTDAENKLLGISTTTAATPTPVPRTTPTPTPTVTSKKFTPAELQNIVRKMTQGEKLTPEEAAAVGVSEPSSITSSPASITPTPTATNTVRTAPKDLNSPEALEYNQYLKGRATAGGLKPEELEWTKTYNKNRYEVLKGKATAGVKLTPAEQAESDFLIGLGIGREDLVVPDIIPPVIPDVIPPVIPDVVPPVVPDGSGTTYTAPDGKIFTDLNAYNTYIADLKKQEKTAAGKSAYDILYGEFDKYGLGSLVSPLKIFIEDGLSEAELTLKLRGTKAYETRFAANKKRIANGFAAIDEATYLGLEDRYQSLMQNYGMPAKYYARGDLGVQSYFEEAIANNVDPITFEDRIIEGKKVLDANKNTLDAAKKFFPTLNDGDFLAYVLDSKNAITDIQRKVTAAEIGGIQIGAGLEATAPNATGLAAAGVTTQGYQKNVSQIAENFMRGSQLSAMYGEDPYTQQTAEQDVLNVLGSVEAKKQTKKLSGLEKASFAGRSGTAQGALNRDRAGAI